MVILSHMNNQIEPILPGEGLVEIYRRLPVENLITEEQRLQTVCSDIMGRLVAISKIREEQQYDQRTLFNQVS